jgi:uncharacterized protein YueI
MGTPMAHQNSQFSSSANQWAKLEQYIKIVTQLRQQVQLVNEKTSNDIAKLVDRVDALELQQHKLESEVQQLLVNENTERPAKKKKGNIDPDITVCTI